MKHTIKRKIEGSMFIANLLTLIIIFAIIIPVFFLTLYPVTYFITKSAADDIVKKYEATRESTTSKAMINQAFTMNYSVDEIIQNLESENDVAMTIPDEIVMDDSDAVIVVENENDKKRLLLISGEIYDNINDFLEAYMVNMDICNITVTMGDQTLSLTKSENVDTDSRVYTMINTHRKRLAIVDADGMQIGELSIAMDPQMLQIVLVPYIATLIVMSLLSILIVKIVSMMMSKGIMRPIRQLNHQLKRIASHQTDEVSRYTLGIKMPPEEIAEMIASSNAIHDKFRILQSTLENQNEELTVQNEELVKNREIIETQQKQLIQNEKMASVGQITAAIVHEINTPIGAIRSNAQMADMVLEQLEGIEDIARIHKQTAKIKTTNQMVVEAADRVIEIIRNIKQFSRIDQSNFQAADLSEGIDSVLLLTSNLWKSRIEIVKTYEPLPAVMCYASLLNQVFMNIITNAIDAIEHTGHIWIKLYQEDERVIIEIADDGIGMSEQTMARVFDQGFTTKPIGKGSGLGLALSQDIMAKHNGWITVESEAGKGTTFKIVLPFATEETFKAH
ncbi:MAG: two-component system, NtrC family, sensor kinase [Clostridiales bacterium]|nr:two-component system, NtrC family, sensor kinase [Clostridiales bacterium]MDN5297859.1 two-component system, NtrC family, sensor kinase [Clostridiales bacterium]